MVIKMCWNEIYRKMAYIPFPPKGEIVEVKKKETIDLPPDTPVPQRPYDK